jgi:hypothetical protein
MTDQPPVNQFPTEESLNALLNDFNDALGKFRSENFDVPNPVICGSALSVMLSYPWTWMGMSGNQDRFVEFMDNEVKNFVAMKAFANQVKSVVTD